MTRPAHLVGFCALLLLACANEPETAVADAAPTAPATSAPAQAEPPPPALPARRFLLVDGTVTLDGQPATVGAEIGATAKIETAKGARAVITFGPGSAIEVRERSRVELGSSTRRKTSLQLLSGVLWSFLPMGQADYEVVTTNAVAGVRGTTFYVDARNPTDTFVCACDGEVEISTDGNLPRNVVSQDEHKSVTIKGKGKKAKLAEKKSKPMSHTPEQAAAIKSLIAP